jgi:large subunit ribosomal protein L20
LFSDTKGFWGARSKLRKTATQAQLKAAQYAYRDRKNRKREFRRLWIQRINAAARTHGFSYSRLMHGLSVAGVELDRKQLSELAINDPSAFEAIVGVARTALDA